MPPKTRTTVQQYARLMVAVYVLLFLFINGLLMFSGYDIKDLPVLVRGFVENASVLAPLAMLAVYSVSAIVPLPTATLAAICGAYFGMVEGFVIALIGLNCSSVVGFTVARHIGAKAIAESKESWIQQGNKLLTEKGFFPILISRVLHVPYDAVNIAGGLSGMRLRTFLLATTLGNLPSVLVFVLFGEHLHDTNSRMVFLLAIVILVVLTYALRKTAWVKRFLIEV